MFFDINNNYFFVETQTKRTGTIEPEVTNIARKVDYSIAISINHTQTHKQTLQVNLTLVQNSLALSLSRNPAQQYRNAILTERESERNFAGACDEQIA